MEDAKSKVNRDVALVGGGYDGRLWIVCHDTDNLLEIFEDKYWETGAEPERYKKSGELTEDGLEIWKVQ